MPLNLESLFDFLKSNPSEQDCINYFEKLRWKSKASTNTIESPWGHLKGTIRTYVKISRKHSQKYIDEFVLRFKTRNYKTEERFDLVLLASVGKSLSYSQLPLFIKREKLTLTTSHILTKNRISH